MFVKTELVSTIYFGCIHSEDEHSLNTLYSNKNLLSYHPIIDPYNPLFFKNIHKKTIDNPFVFHSRSMLELAQSLILNEEALNSLPENKRPVFIYEWLCFLNKVLIAAQKVN
jgi:hypothetical protein